MEKKYGNSEIISRRDTEPAEPSKKVPQRRGEHKEINVLIQFKFQLVLF